MLPPLAGVACDAVEEGLQEARAAWSSRAGPRSTHCGRRASMLSFVRRMGRVKRVNGCVYRPEQHGAGVSVTLRRNHGAATGSDLDMRKMTVAAT
jgi:hypothetical protein